MSAYLVTYDLVGTDAGSENHNRVIETLEGMGAKRVQESVLNAKSSSDLRRRPRVCTAPGTQRPQAEPGAGAAI